ncbi:MAG TPA: DUF3078 domain-containing protein [Cytophagaceae bacterium]
MKKTAFYLLLILMPFLSTAQDADTTKLWDKGLNLNLNLTQVGLTNWVGGGQNTLAVTGLSSSFANYKKGNRSWENSLDLGYGLVRLGTDAPFRKSDDRFILVSRYGVQQTQKLKYLAQFDFRSQFAPGYKYFIDTADNNLEKSVFISDLLSPAYMTISLGLEYSPTKNLFIYLSPITNKNTIVLNKALANQGAYGVEKGNKFRKELGTYMSIRYNKDVMENITYKTNLNLFANYTTFDAIDVNWENILFLKVNKYVNVSFTTNFLYDDDIDIIRKDGSVGPAIQFKEVLTVGIGINMK